MTSKILVGIAHRLQGTTVPDDQNYFLALTPSKMDFLNFLYMLIRYNSHRN